MPDKTEARSRLTERLAALMSQAGHRDLPLFAQGKIKAFRIMFEKVAREWHKSNAPQWAVHGAMTTNTQIGNLAYSGARVTREPMP